MINLLYLKKENLDSCSFLACINTTKDTPQFRIGTTFLADFVQACWGMPNLPYFMNSILDSFMCKYTFIQTLFWLGVVRYPTHLSSWIKSKMFSESFTCTQALIKALKRFSFLNGCVRTCRCMPKVALNWFYYSVLFQI